MSNEHRSDDDRSTPTQFRVFALLLALLAVSLIASLPVPQSDVDFAAEDANLGGEVNNRIADSPPPGSGLAFDDANLSGGANNRAADSPPPGSGLAVEDANLSGEANNRVVDSPPPGNATKDVIIGGQASNEVAASSSPTTGPAAQDDPSSEASSEVADSPAPTTGPAAEEALSGEPTNEVAESPPPTTGPAAGDSNLSGEPTNQVAASPPPTTGPSAEDGNTQKVKLPIYDTSWELFQGLPLSDVDEYFGYLKENGYSGVWASILPIGYQAGGAPTNSALIVRDSGGNVVAERQGTNIRLTTGHIDHITAYLDAAQRHGIELNLVLAWASNNVRSVDKAGDPDCQQRDGPRTRQQIIDEDNAYAYGQNVAEAFGKHPAIAYWILGGDDIWECDSAQIWINMKAGLQTADNGQPTTYHTSLNNRKYANESWNEFLSPQTGWDDQSSFDGLLGNLKGETGKVTYASELRYYLDFDYTADEVASETAAVFADGVDAIVYGDIRRAFPCMRGTFFTYQYCDHISETFNSPGEDAFFSVVGLEN